MKKTILSLLLCSFSMSFATYQVVFPNQTVNFKYNTNPDTPTTPEEPTVPETPEEPEKFTPTDPLISEWYDVGNPYNCNNYAPNVGDYSYGVKFTQTATDCSLNQERTIQNRQISSRTNEISNVGEPTTEQQTLTDQSNSRESTGTRYNYILYVGSYTAWGTPSYGYFSDSYLNTYQGNVTTAVSGSMSSYTYKGSTIDHLVEQNGNITLRLLPSLSGQPSPVLTVNGATCTLEGPTVYSSYDAYNCKMRIINDVGKNLYIDLR